MVLDFEEIFTKFKFVLNKLLDNTKVIVADKYNSNSSFKL